MPGGGTWGKSSATRSLFALLCSSLGLGIVSVFFTNAGLTGLKAQGEGKCREAERSQKEIDSAYPGLGKWDDGAGFMYLNWHVCEVPPTNDPPRTGHWDRRPVPSLDGSWYSAVCGWHTYHSANESCASMNASLVTINSQQENDFVRKLIGYEAAFIGLSERQGTEEWEWASGRNCGMATNGHFGSNYDCYSNWAKGEPNNHKGRVDESIALMNHWMRLDMPDPSHSAGACHGGAPRGKPVGTGTWVDIPIDTRIQYTVCERNDSAGSCPDGTWYRRLDTLGKGHCYKNVCGMYNDFEALRACHDLGAIMVSIGSEEENNFVLNLCGIHSCRIGLRRTNQGSESESWVWSDGRDVGQKYEWKGYVNWADGEPNRYEDAEGSSVVMNTQGLHAEMRKAFLYQRITPVVWTWMLVTLCLPLLLLVATAFSSRFNSSCCAQALCIVTGVASVGLGVEIFFLITTATHVNDLWPGGSANLLKFLVVVAIVQIIICCCATSKAQELQWSVGGWGFSSMGVREVSDFADPLQSQQGNMPGTGSGISLQMQQPGSQQA